jgi:hypothetical protein
MELVAARAEDVLNDTTILKGIVDGLKRGQYDTLVSTTAYISRSNRSVTLLAAILLDIPTARAHLQVCSAGVVNGLD